jgi:hypothetical protein
MDRREASNRYSELGRRRPARNNAWSRGHSPWAPIRADWNQWIAYLHRITGYRPEPAGVTRLSNTLIFPQNLSRTAFLKSWISRSNCPLLVRKNLISLSTPEKAGTLPIHRTTKERLVILRNLNSTCEERKIPMAYLGQRSAPSLSTYRAISSVFTAAIAICMSDYVAIQSYTGGHRTFGGRQGHQGRSLNRPRQADRQSTPL